MKFPFLALLLFSSFLLISCGDDDIEQCAEVTKASLCPAGTAPSSAAEGSESCEGSGSADLLSQTGEVSGGCVSEGSCSVFCEVIQSCPCGVKSITRDALTCEPCTATTCGDGVTEEGEECDQGSDNGSGNGCDSNCNITTNNGDGCTNNARQCITSSIIQLCSDGIWNDFETCESGTVCQDPGECVDESLGPVCGDNNAEGAEACDGDDLNGATCEGEGFGGGSVACVGCELDTSNCENAATPDGMVRIPASGATTVFMMGRPSSDNWVDATDQPDHEVTLDAYWIDIYEVTASNYAACVATGGCSVPETGTDATYGVTGRENHPVNYVTWQQADDYCQSEGKRLLTEAEWERAAVGTTYRRFPWGNDCPGSWHSTCSGPEWTSGTAKANCDESVCNDGFDTTSPVGSFQEGVTPEGVHGLAGNVYEWTADWYDSSYYTVSPSINPAGPSSGTERVVRGGRWNDIDPGLLRTTHRFSPPPTVSLDVLGFRCAVSVP